MKKLKVAIIGATGFAAEKMLPQLQKSEVCEVVAIQARNEEKIAQIAKQFRVSNYYTNVSKMLEQETYDLVYIVTPPFLHFQDIKICCQSGKVKNILCEKPIVLTEEEVSLLQNLAAKHTEVKIFVGHHIRHQKALKDLKDMLENKVVGDVTSVKGSWGYQLDTQASYTVWKLDQSKGGASVMGDPGIHVIDAICALFGLPKEVKARGSSELYKTTFDNVTAVLKYDSLEATVGASQTTPDAKNDLIIIGNTGRIEIPNFFSQTYIPLIKIETPEGIQAKDYTEEFLYKNEVEQILGFYKDGLPATSLEEGIEETKILLNINNQLRK